MGRMTLAPEVEAALEFQRAAVEHASLASPLYHALLDTLLADGRAGGVTAELFAAAPDGVDPIADALVLRFLGALHRVVLDGRAPALGRWYPTVGGSFDAAAGDDPSGDLLAAVAEHREELIDGLRQGVQTNEVGRCAALAVGFTALVRRFGLPLHLLELGASGGLNLRWDAWRYESGPTAWGDEGAALRFVDAYAEPWVTLEASLGPDEIVAGRRGCDVSPIDATSEAGQRLLRSFVWPDQHARFARLEAALAAAAARPATVERADAGDWAEAVLAEPVPGAVRVLYHSIVWQYVPAASRRRVADAVERAGASATPQAPVAWLCMEPGEDLADAAQVRLRCWPGGGEEELLAYSGYHGFPVWDSSTRRPTS